MAFTELSLRGVFPQHEVVTISRSRQTEQALQRHLTGGAWGDVATAHDAIHADARIINDHGELIGNDTITADDDRISCCSRRMLTEVKTTLIAQLNELVIKSTADRFTTATPVVSWQRAAAFVIVVGPRSVRRAASALGEFTPRRCAWIETARCSQTIQRGSVASAVGGLVFNRIPIQAEPREIVA